MREIKFRGKRVDNGKWVYGYSLRRLEKKEFADDTKEEVFYISDIEQDCMIDIEVIPESVGQFTGFKDKNGKMIYVGDIVEHDCDDYIVEFDNAAFMVSPTKEIFDINNQNYHYKGLWNISHNYEIIGNIYENKELLKDVKSAEGVKEWD